MRSASGANLGRYVTRGAPIAAAIFFSGATTMALAQESVEDLQKRKAVLEAQKAAVDAEIALNESKKKLAALQASPNSELEAARNAKEIADAKKAQADSELAAFKAKVGDVPSSGITGSVELTDKAGSMETALLAAVAVKSASSQVARHVADALVAGAAAGQPTSAAASPPRRIVIFPAGDVPTFQATSAFFAQRAILLRALMAALEGAKEAEAVEKSAEPRAESVAAAGIALEAVSKVLGFFRTDFKIGGTELTADHALLAEAVGGELRSKHFREKTEILLKAAFNPGAVLNAGAILLVRSVAHRSLSALCGDADHCSVDRLFSPAGTNSVQLDERLQWGGRFVSG